MARRLAQYVRVSRKGERDFDKTLTQDVQRQAMAQYVAGRTGLTLHAEPFDDLDRPAPDFDPANRPEYARAKAWVMEAPTKRGLIVKDASRFGRNDLSMYELGQFHSAGALVVFSDTGHTSDLMGTPDGYFQLVIALGLASTERMRVGASWRKTIEERTRRGLHHGKVPVGYVRVPKKDANGQDNPNAGLLVFADDAEAVRQLFTDYANGVSVGQLAKRLAEINGADVVQRSTIKHMMKNEVFIGKIRRKDEYLDGAHAALVDDDTWAKVQRRNRVERKQSSQLAEPRSFLAGLMRCAECGGSVVIVNQKSRGIFVACRKNRTIPAGAANRCKGFGTPLLKTVENAFMDICGLMPSEEHLHLAEDEADGRKALEARIAALTVEQAKAVGGRDRLAVAYAKGTMSDTAFESGLAALESEISERADLLKELQEDLLLMPSEPVDRAARGRTMLDVIETRSVAEARNLLRHELETFGITRLAPGRFGYFPVWKS